VDLAAELLAQSMLKDEAVAKVNSLCDSLDSIAMAVCSLGELSDRNKALIISAGEYLSSTIIAYAMNSKGIRTKWIDAREMMVTNNSYLKAEPDMNAIAEKVPGVVSAAYEGMDAVITQGFVGVTEGGEPTVLGRGGSDYSASLIGMAVDADRIEIWTDVDGVRTADPRYVKNTKYLEKISFEEAAEMAHFGAKVLHPLTIEPAVKKNIAICVLNSMNPSGKGTAILRNELIEDGVKSVSFKENIKVINIFSTRMINTSGFLRRVFEIFSESKVSVDLISTSEANISVTVDASQNIEPVVAELSEFADVIVDDDKSQVSVIGKNIVRLNGMLKKTFTPLKKCNVYMISQGASFVNISFVVDREELSEVVQDLHDHLFDQAEELETF
jgi:aspartate kinase